MNFASSSIHFVDGEDSYFLEPSRIAGYVLALFHVFVFSFPLRQLFVALYAQSGHFFPVKAATLVSASLAAVAPWAFFAGMACRITLAKGKRLPKTISAKGESLTFALLRCVVHAIIAPLMTITPVIIGLCLCQSELLPALALMVLAPVVLALWSAAGLGLTLLLWPKKLTVTVSKYLRLGEALGVIWFVLLFRVFGPEQVFSSKGLEALQGLGATLVTMTPLFNSTKAAVSYLLGGEMGWGVLLLPLCLVFSMALLFDGLSRYKRNVDEPGCQNPNYCPRGEGYCSPLLTVSIWSVLLHLALISNFGANFRTITIWSIVVGGVGYYFVIRWARFSEKESLLNEALYPQNMTMSILLKQCMTAFAGGFAFAAFFLGIGVLRSWYTTMTYIVILVSMAVLFFVGTIVVKIPWGQNGLAHGNPGGTFVKLRPFSLAHMLACETVFVFIVAVLSTGTYVFYRYQAPAVVSVAWIILALLSLGGTLFFGGIVPLLVWFNKGKYKDRPFAA